MASGTNYGSQVEYNYGTINNEFHPPPERAETPPTPSAWIPFDHNPDFVDRGDLLDQVHRICSEPPRRVALVGIGGIGKSQLAIEYTRRISDASASLWVFWVHAGTRARVEEGFRTIADAVKLAGRNQPKADVPLLVYNWLSNERNGKWLMAIDSADDSGVFLSTAEGASDGRKLLTYLPRSRNGSIVITTRNKRLADLVTGNRDNVIEVGPMTETEAIALLEKKLGSATDWDGILAKDLAKALDLIPLAISQAASYIKARRPRSSLEKYLGTFRESKHKRIRLLKHDAGDLWRDGEASNAVFTTWQISFNYIRSKRPSAADLLALMSFFDRQGIPEWVLKGNKPTKDTASDTKTEDIGSDSNDSNSNDKSDGVANDDADSEFDEDVEMLRDYCLITTNEQGDEFEMHRLVQLSTREWLAESGQQDIFQQQYIKRMVSAFPKGEFENWTICRSLFAHAQVVLGYRPNAEEVEDWAYLLCKGGSYALLQGKYNVAEQMLGEAYKVSEKSFGKEAMLTLYSTSLFAQVLMDQGLCDKAEKLELQVMETHKLKLGADHPHILTSMNNLASIYWNQGRWEEAEKLNIQVMEARKLKLGADHPHTLISISNLAATYWNQGRWEEAEKLYVQVMETYKLKLGADHPHTLISISNLALIYRNKGRWEEAEKLELQVMETRKLKLEADHPHILRSMNNLASIYRNQGRWEEAEKLDLQVMETYKLKLGVDHLDTLTSINNLASTYQNQGRWEEAEKLELQVTETLKLKLGVDHPDTLISIANLASIYENQGRWEEAEKLGLQVMETRKLKLGADHPDTLISMNNLAHTWHAMGKTHKATDLMEACVSFRKVKLGLDHPYTQYSIITLDIWKGSDS